MKFMSYLILYLNETKRIEFEQKHDLQPIEYWEREMAIWNKEKVIQQK